MTDQTPDAGRDALVDVGGLTSVQRDKIAAIIDRLVAEARKDGAVEALVIVRDELGSESAADVVESKIRTEWPISTHRWSADDTTPHGWAHTALSVATALIEAHRQRVEGGGQ